jgi:hypothetical protein
MESIHARGRLWLLLTLELMPSQVEKRCLEVWGSEEALEEEIAKKAVQREVSKQKKFKKKMQGEGLETMKLPPILVDIHHAKNFKILL